MCAPLYNKIVGMYEGTSPSLADRPVDLAINIYDIARTSIINPMHT